MPIKPSTKLEKGEDKSFWQDIRSLKKLWPYLRDQRRLIIIAVILIPLISLLEMFTPLVIQKTIDKGVTPHDWGVIQTGSLIYLCLVVFQYFCRSGQSLSAAFAVHRMILKMRHAVIRHALNLRCAFHDRSLSGTLVTRATSDFDNLSESLNTGVLTSVIDFAVLIGSISGLFILSWKLALCSLAACPMIYLIVVFFSKGLKVSMLRARARIAELNAFAQECLYGNATIKLLNAHEHAQRKHDKLVEEFRRAQMGSVVLDASMFSIIDGLTSIMVGVILYAALTSVTNQNVVSAGVMIAFVQYTQQMFEPIKQLSNKIAMLQGAFTSIERVFGILDTREFITGETKIESIQGDIRFEHVSFSYSSDKEKKNSPVLKDVSFHVEKGKSVALVGHTGSGKSTTIKLLTKLYDGYEGQIFIDNHEIKNLDAAILRQSIAIVPQDIVMFDGSVSFNISLGLPFISEEDIIDACKTVGADRFIDELPGGYSFPIREQGANLSFGMRQLIAFARALAKKPKLVVLDEATSSVDPESEEMVQKGINSLLKGRTVLVIAHRLSTIENCDDILVFDHGEVVESGSHQSLISKNGVYAGLYSAAQGETEA